VYLAAHPLRRSVQVVRSEGQVLIGGGDLEQLEMQLSTALPDLADQLDQQQLRTAQVAGDVLTDVEVVHARITTHTMYVKLNFKTPLNTKNYVSYCKLKIINLQILE